MKIRGRLVTPISTPSGGFTKIGLSNGLKGQPTHLLLFWYCLDTTGNRICDSGNWKSTGASTSANLSGLVEGTDYYWQVRARNAAGSAEADGGTWWKFSPQKSGSTLYLPLVLNQYSSGSGSSSETLIDQAVAAGILEDDACRSVLFQR